jgi:hypothetical protein
MDATQDLILGVLGGPWCGFKYPGVEAYLVSIKRSGFIGRKVMIIWDIRPEVRQKLLEYGFELVDISSLTSGLRGNVHQGSFFHDRMRVCAQYLKEHHQEFRYVIWIDIKDIVLQNDPSVWLEKNIGDYGIVASNECVTIEKEETNQLWARTILGVEKYLELKDEEVINGGTWAGKSEVMAEIFQEVSQGCDTYHGCYPPCQIWINWILRQSPFKEQLYIPRWSEGFAACLHPCWSPWRTPCWPHKRDPHPVLDLNTCTLYAGTTPDPKNPMILFNNAWGKSRRIEIVTPSDPLRGVECVINPTSKPFTIIHGYDRDWDLKSLFEFKYLFDARFDLEKYKHSNEEDVKSDHPWKNMYDFSATKEFDFEAFKKVNNSIPLPRRALRRTDESLIGRNQLSPTGRVFTRRP